MINNLVTIFIQERNYALHETLLVVILRKNLFYSTISHQTIT
jgi:hypothetical protein